MTTRQDLTIRQGETFSWTYTKLDSAGAAVDLTGYSARMAIKRTFEADEEAYLSTGADAAGGSITLGDEAGTVVLSMTAAETTALAGDLTAYIFGVPSKSAQRYETFIYDLELVAGDGTVTRELQGRVIVEREVTG